MPTEPGRVPAVADRVQAAVRAWATKVPKKRATPAPVDADEGQGDEPPPTPILWMDPGPSQFSLVFDTETTMAISQQLRVLAYQVHEGADLVESGFAFNPDGVAELELAALRRHADVRGLMVQPLRDFITEVLVPIFVEKRGLLVGFNLPFDISRIASGHGRVAPGRGPDRSVDHSMVGGVSFRFDGTDVRVQVKRTSARGAFIRLALGTGTSVEKLNREHGGNMADHRGYVVDVSTIAGAMLGRKLSLKRTAEILGTKHQKLDVDLGRAIDDELLRYAMNDVDVTWDCFVDLGARYEALGLVQTPIWRIQSEASIGKAHLREMGLVPWRQSQPDFPPHLLAGLMESYCGGRVECGIRAVPVPGVLVDFTSQYPTVSTLMGTWRFHIATGIEAVEEPPDAVQTMLAAVTADDVLRPDFWRTLDAIVWLVPTTARLPTRADYTEPTASRRRRSGSAPTTRNLALPVRTDGLPQWWTLADAVASVLLTGQAPRVLRVLRYRPIGLQEGLSTIAVVGLASGRVDPYGEDFVRRLVELRKTTTREAAAARASGRIRLADELDARSLAIKKAANSIAYGVPIEVNVTESGTPTTIRVYQPDESTYDAFGIHRTEDPGKWFHPLIATLVVAGGRLLLATAERLVRNVGGTFAYCDTDGMFVVATEAGGWVTPTGVAADRSVAPIPALSWAQVDATADRFEALNPYDRAIIPGSILSIVDVAYDPETGERREVWCYSIAAKRYVLFTIDPAGRPRVAISSSGPHRSEHALGHLLPPVDPSAEDWVSHWWEHLLCLELDIADAPPDWFEHPAVGTLTVTSAQDERAFATYNQPRPYQDRVRPWGFAMTAHPHPLARLGGGPRVLVAPRATDPTQRLTADWFDRASPGGDRFEIRVGDPTFVVPGVVVVQSCGDYFEEFRRHPEVKAAGPDGERCHTWTRGQLGPRDIEVTGLVRISKETGRLATDPASGEASSSLAIEYRESVCEGCGLVIPFTNKWCSDACRKRTKRRLGRETRKCGWCGSLLPAGKRKWCSDLCRKREARAHQNRRT